MPVYLTALNPTDAVIDGFLPAAARLGLPVTVLTDQPEAWPDCGAAVAGCDVRDPRAVIEELRDPAALLSNSDHLQMATALAAEFLGLPGKDWRAALRCKDKAMMRRAIADAGLDTVTTAVLHPGDGLPQIPFPAVVKPREGVASEDAYLVGDRDELAARVTEIQGRRPDAVLIVEEYLEGELRTFETLGDGNHLASLGGWHTTLGPAPTFIEESLDWSPYLPAPAAASLRAQLDVLGVGFGACHTEFVLCGGRARLIEVNYRLIGDRMDLILAELLGVPLFEYVLRLHLGERLETMDMPDPATLDRYARVEYVCADRSGTLTRAPSALDLRDGGVRLACRPLRTVGSMHTLSGTNRDYLAVLHGLGEDRERIRKALGKFRNSLRWEVR